MEDRRLSIADEIRIIPAWSYILAAVCFVTVQWFFYEMPIRRPVTTASVAFHTGWGIITGLMLALFMLLIGYVNRDARRRGMNVALWTLLVVLSVPNAIGFVVYFMMRHPLVLNCPKCSYDVQSGFNFCPNCRYAMVACCPECQRPALLGATFCSNCGTTLQDAPSKLSIAR